MGLERDGGWSHLVSMKTEAIASRANGARHIEERPKKKGLKIKEKVVRTPLTLSKAAPVLPRRGNGWKDQT